MALTEMIDRLEAGDYDWPLADEAAFKAAWQAATLGLDPLAAAFCGGLLADRLSWVFVSAYQSAVRQCFTGVPDGVYTSFAVSESGELPGTTLDDEGRLSGNKSWIASSRLVDHLVVTLGADLRHDPVAVNVGPGVALSHRDKSGFLGDMSQGSAMFDRVQATPVTEHTAFHFGMAEPFFLMAAGTGYLLKEARRLGDAALAADAGEQLTALPVLYEQGFAEDRQALSQQYDRVAALGRSCAMMAGKRPGREAEDWRANGRVLGMYGRGLRSQ